jgi:hypothetical protein
MQGKPKSRKLDGSGSNLIETKMRDCSLTR